jgi:hypothetical protein
MRALEINDLPRKIQRAGHGTVTVKDSFPVNSNLLSKMPRRACSISGLMDLAFARGNRIDFPYL